MGDPDRGPTVTDEEILAVFDEVDDEWLQTGQAADNLPIPDHQLRERLDDLEERDLLVREDEDLPGEQWQLTPDGQEAAGMPEEEVESELEAQATKTTGSEAPPRREETPESPPPDPQEDPFGSMPDSASEEIEAFAGAETPDVEERRREAIRRVYAYLRQRGPATRADLENDIFPVATGAYERPEEWWNELVRPGLESIPGVVYRDDTWHSVDESEEVTES